MSLISFSLAVIFIIKLLSGSGIKVKYTFIHASFHKLTYPSKTVTIKKQFVDYLTPISLTCSFMARMGVQ